MNDRAAVYAAVKMEEQRRLKMTDAEVADEIEKTLAVMHDEKVGKAEHSAAYCQAWIDAGFLLFAHGAAIVTALRKSRERAILSEETHEQPR